MRYRYLLDVFEILKNEPSTNAKKEILEKLKHDKTLTEVLRLCYDKTINFHIKKIPEYRANNSFDGKSLRRALIDIEKTLSTRLKTGNDAKLFLENLLEELVTEDAKVLEMVIKRNMECGISSKTINSVWPGLIPTFDISLCSDFDESEVVYPCFAQEKLDGMRALLFVHKNNKYTIKSRKGLFIDDMGAFQGLANSLVEGVILDCELMVLNEDKTDYLPRKKSNGIANKAIQGTVSKEETERFVLEVFDVINMDVFNGLGPSLTTKQRFDILTNEIGNVIKQFDNVRIVNTHILNNSESIHELFNQYTDIGKEGIIVKNFDSIWEPKRMKGWMKLKLEQTIELEIVKAVEGLGKLKGMLGSLKCKDLSGDLNVGVPGFPENLREELWNKKDELPGQIITVLYNEIVTKGDGYSLFLPRFVELRLDKDKADSIYDIK